jgi:hypothetical protein
MLGRLIGFWGGRDLELKLLQLLVGHFPVLDVGSDHFLIAADGRDKISAVGAESLRSPTQLEAIV